MKDQEKKPRRFDGIRKPQLYSPEDILHQEGYPDNVIENYTRLLQVDMHLAEFYRLANAPATSLEGNKIRVNPIQASVDSEGKILVDVLIELKDEISAKELYGIMQIHGATGRLVAGRIYADRAPQLLEKALRIETSRPVAPTLEKSVPAIQADPAALVGAFPTEFRSKKLNGQGVIIGIIDHGCDFKHCSFRKGNESRLLYLWDQTGSGNHPPAPFNYGIEYNQNQINQALQTQDPYTALGYTPGMGAHGTHVMAIAAGSSDKFAGVATGADLIFVHLGKAAKPAGTNQEPADEEFKSFGSSWNLFTAVLYILEKADQLNKPVVINISQGMNGGPHDGTTIIETLFDEVLTKKGRAIVIAAGNSRNNDIHISGEVPPQIPQTILWRINKKSPPASEVHHEMEIWYDRNGALTVQIFSPQNTLLGECSLGEEKIVSSGDGVHFPILIRNMRPDSIPGEDENLINILLDDRAFNQTDGQVWKIVLAQNPAANANVHYHAWIERNDPAQSSFATGSQSAYTLNTIGNATLPIVVGAYDARTPPFRILPDSGEGPTRHKQINAKPDICAPGWHIISARAQTGCKYMALSGTSMAAPHVSGVIALMFQAARDWKNPSQLLSCSEIRDVLITTADNNTSTEGYQPQYGFGRVNAVKALKKILK